MRGVVLTMLRVIGAGARSELNLTKFEEYSILRVRFSVLCDKTIL